MINKDAAFFNPADKTVYIGKIIAESTTTYFVQVSITDKSGKREKRVFSPLKENVQISAF